MEKLKTSAELLALVKASVEAFKALPKDEQERQMDEQRKSYVRSEMAWPKSKYKFVNGVKVYDSYEDYVND